MKSQRLRRQSRVKEKEDDIKPLSNYDIVDLIAQLKVPHFRGVFMRDTLTRGKNQRLKSKQECWILNHGSSRTSGTHWTALARNGNIAFYFDSFGKLPPPFEVIEYLSGYKDGEIQLYYNVKQYQHYGSNICGHLCLKFLYDFWKRQKGKEYISFVRYKE